MALINCPECGKEISNKSKQCIHCGFPLQEDENTKCIINGKDYDLSFILYSDIDSISAKGEKILAVARLNKKLSDMVGHDSSPIDFEPFVKQILETKEIPRTMYFDFLAEAERKAKEEAGKPHCPTCGSTNITRLSALKRAAHGYMFGLFSKTARSEWECKSCGSKW